MTNRERELRTLSFDKMEERGSVLETFQPWDLTVDRFKEEGLPIGAYDGGIKTHDYDMHFGVDWSAGVTKYEEQLGFDAVRRVTFQLPFRYFEKKTIEETPEYTIIQDNVGRHIKIDKITGTERLVKETIETQEDWINIKKMGEKRSEEIYTEENMKKAYGSLIEGHDRGDYTIRLSIEGFFWTPREILGIEPHLYAFYDEPELMHDINQTILDIYKTKLLYVIKLIQPDTIYISEDLSGKNGPMLSQEFFREFVGDYYKKIIPIFKENGVKIIFVDTDGDFNQLIPDFMETGVEGFLPMDVNAGMDIVKVRETYKNLKFIGGFNKLCISEGKEAIDKEFERILPVIREGGYIPGADHQVAPSTSLEDYKYYITKLKEIMKQAGHK